MMLMLLGNAGLVTVMTTLILTFVGSQGTASTLERLGMLAVGLVLLAWFAYSPWVDRQLSRVIDIALRRMTDLDTRDYVSLLHLQGEYRLVEMLIRPDDWIAGMRLMDARTRNEGVIVIAIRRAEDDCFIGSPEGETEIRAGDTLVLYGRASALTQLDQRRKGWEGDKEHFEAVAAQRAYEKEEKQREAQRASDAEQSKKDAAE
jgi:NhaP-type Na+/H+ and K+/H+ antiporter